MLDSKAMKPIMVTVNELVTVVVPGYEVVSKALISIYNHIPEAHHFIFLSDAPKFGAVNKSQHPQILFIFSANFTTFYLITAVLCPIVDLLILLIKA